MGIRQNGAARNKLILRKFNFNFMSNAWLYNVIWMGGTLKETSLADTVLKQLNLK